MNSEHLHSNQLNLTPRKFFQLSHISVNISVGLEGTTRNQSDWVFKLVSAVRPFLPIRPSCQRGHRPTRPCVHTQSVKGSQATADYSGLH